MTNNLTKILPNVNPEVTDFLDKKSNPFRIEIELLRKCILSVNENIAENIKWNAPNYVFNNEDRITMRINNIKKVQLIFHCGAKVKMQPKDKLISEDFGLLDWKENNRAVATFDDIKGIYNNKKELEKIIENWLKNAV